MTPVSITVSSSSTPVRYNMEMAQDRLLSPMLLQMMIYSALDATERTLGSGAVRIHGQIEFEGVAEPLRFDNLHSGDVNVPLQTALATAMPLGYALQNAVEEIRVRKVEIALDSFTVKKQASIENAWLSRREARPGEQCGCDGGGGRRGRRAHEAQAADMTSRSARPWERFTSLLETDPL